MPSIDSIHPCPECLDPAHSKLRQTLISGCRSQANCPSKLNLFHKVLQNEISKSTRTPLHLALRGVIKSQSTAANFKPKVLSSPRFNNAKKNEKIQKLILDMRKTKFLNKKNEQSSIKVEDKSEVVMDQDQDDLDSGTNEGSQKQNELKDESKKDNINVHISPKLMEQDDVDLGYNTDTSENDVENTETVIEGGEYVTDSEMEISENRVNSTLNQNDHDVPEVVEDIKSFDKLDSINNQDDIQQSSELASVISMNKDDDFIQTGKNTKFDEPKYTNDGFVVPKSCDIIRPKTEENVEKSNNSGLCLKVKNYLNIDNYRDAECFQSAQNIISIILALTATTQLNKAHYSFSHSSSCKDLNCNKPFCKTFRLIYIHGKKATHHCALRHLWTKLLGMHLDLCQLPTKCGMQKCQQMQKLRKEGRLNLQLQ